MNRTVGQRHGLERRFDSALNVRRNMLRSAVDQIQILVKAKSDLRQVSHSGLLSRVEIQQKSLDKSRAYVYLVQFARDGRVKADTITQCLPHSCGIVQCGHGRVNVFVGQYLMHMILFHLKIKRNA